LEFLWNLGFCPGKFINHEEHEGHEEKMKILLWSNFLQYIDFAEVTILVGIWNFKVLLKSGKI